MPTFQSIPIHPVLKERLVSPQSSSSSTSKTAQVRIPTPHALLCRPPEHVLKCIYPHDGNSHRKRPHGTSNKQHGGTGAVGMEHVTKLRAQIANAMIGKTSIGQLVKHQQSQASQLLQGTKRASNVPFIPGVTHSVQSQVQWEKQHFPNLKYTTGCDELDEMLEFPMEYDNVYERSHAAGGISFDQPGCSLGGHVWQISGPSSCGKTQLVLQIIAHAAIRDAQSGNYRANDQQGDKTTTAINTTNNNGSRTQPARGGPSIYYVASSSGHPARAVSKRLQQMIQTYISTSAAYADVNPIDALNRIGIISISNPQELAVFLARVQQQQHRQSQQPNHTTTTPHLIVIDSICNLLWQSSSIILSHNSTMNPPDEIRNVGRKCKQLSRLFGMAVVVTNSIGSNSTRRNRNHDVQSLYPATTNAVVSRKNAALGHAWGETAIDGHLELQTAEISKRIVLVRHPAKVCEDQHQQPLLSLSVAYEVDGAGIAVVKRTESDSSKRRKI